VEPARPPVDGAFGPRSGCGRTARCSAVIVHAIQHAPQRKSDLPRQRRRHGVADLPADGALAALEEVVVGEALQACILEGGGDAVVGVVHEAVPVAVGHRRCRGVRVEETTCLSGTLVAASPGTDAGELCDGGLRMAGVVVPRPTVAGSLSKVVDGVTHRQVWTGEWQRVGVRPAVRVGDRDRPQAVLRDAVVGGIEDHHAGVGVASLGQAVQQVVEQPPVPVVEQLGHVLEDHEVRSQQSGEPDRLPVEQVAWVAGSPLARRGEALAGPTGGQDVDPHVAHTGEHLGVAEVTDVPEHQVAGREVELVGGGGVLVHLDGEQGPEPGLLEPEADPPGSTEEVHERAGSGRGDPAGLHPHVVGPAYGVGLRRGGDGRHFGHRGAWGACSHRDAPPIRPPSAIGGTHSRDPPAACSTVPVTAW